MGVVVLQQSIKVGIRILNDHPYILLLIGISFLAILIFAIYRKWKSARQNKKEKSTDSKKKAK